MFTKFVLEYFSNKILEICGQNHDAVNFIFSILLIEILHHNKNQTGLKNMDGYSKVCMPLLSFFFFFKLVTRTEKLNVTFC